MTDLRPETFSWGVASGDPTATSIMVWTRIDVGNHAEPDVPAVAWEVWELRETPDRAVAKGVAHPADDGTVGVHVTGLAPGRRYGYRFGVGNSWSVDGSTATLDPDSTTMRLGIACCARLASGPLVAYEGLRLAAPDLIVHLGDYIYEDGGSGDDHGEPPEPPWECITFDDYSARYAQYRRDEHLHRLHRSTPWVVMPDDHEVTDDAFPPEHQTSGHQSSEHQSSEDQRTGTPVDPPSSARKADAIAAHQRWMPQADHGNGPTTFDRHVPLGCVGDLIMVDTRLGGRQEPAGNGPTSIKDPAHHNPSDGRSLLSDAQWEWLDQVIGSASRPWLILASQVQVAPLRLGWLPRLSWPPALRTVVNPDQWDGYPADRERLIQLLDRHDVDKVLIISGDLHSRFVSTIPRSTGGRLVEVTTPSVTAPTFASLIERRLPLPSRWRAWRLVARWIRLINPHIVDMDLAEHGTTLLDVDAESIMITGVAPTGRARQRWRVTSEGVVRAR